MHVGPNLLQPEASDEQRVVVVHFPSPGTCVCFTAADSFLNDGVV